MGLYDFLEELGLPDDTLSDVESETVGGWTIETLEHFPESGESFEWKDWKVTVVEAEDHRVSKLLVEKMNNEKEE